ncbi:MAG TPA: hypothetical protein VFG33_00110 [Kribbella sp.]|uniref:hypothetical protein n=1 Tax=Kribbella sp. TaxID=1871183 RepID=UPI002D7A268D|nr:hypothetical protein [Kribbella sp.]HET6291733.1 hypothetical protein [Kribbella sp.]
MSPTKVTTAGRVAAAFNRHGSWTARVTEHDMAVELRHVDSGDFATTVWLPENGLWIWTGPFPAVELNELPESAGLADLVKAVTESLPEES